MSTVELQECGHPASYCHGCDSSPCDESKHDEA